MRRVLAVMASPRKNRNTDTALDYLLETVNREEFEVKKIYLRDLNIEDCVGCEYCGKAGECIKKDDMDLVYEEFDKSDIIILAAPIYFNSVNALAKSMIDRCQKYWSLKYSLGDPYKRGENRKGIFLSTGGAPFHYDQFTVAFPVLDYFFRAINADYTGNYFISNSDRNPVKDREDIKLELNQIGRDLSDIKPFTIQR